MIFMCNKDNVQLIQLIIGHRHNTIEISFFSLSWLFPPRNAALDLGKMLSVYLVDLIGLRKTGVSRNARLA